MESITAADASHTLIHLTDAEFEKLTGFVYQTYGIDLHRKRLLIEGRLANELRSRGLSSFSSYMEVLFADKTGNEMNRFLSKITTNHSFSGGKTNISIFC